MVVGCDCEVCVGVDGSAEGEGVRSSGFCVVVDEGAGYIVDCAAVVIYCAAVGIRVTRNVIAYEVAGYVADCARVVYCTAVGIRVTRNVVAYEVAGYGADCAVIVINRAASGIIDTGNVVADKICAYIAQLS